VSAAARNLRTGLIAGAVACFMVGMGFAAVPLYRIFCQQTGFGGTARIEEGAKAPGDTGKIVTVDHLVKSSERAGLAASGYLAADMESAQLLDAARGRPAAVIRAV